MTLLPGLVLPWSYTPTRAKILRAKSVCKLLQVTKTRTTPYHPAPNGQVERFNRTLLQMIRCYVDQNQKNWDQQLPLLTSAYRNLQHAITGFTPNRLMLGREVSQPQDIWSGSAELKSDRADVPDFLHSLTEGLREAQNTAREHLRVAQECQKRTHDVRAGERSYSVGDLVYVKDDTKKKGHSPKLQGPWVGPLVVSACRGPVLYEIQGRKRSKIMHHDRLKPYSSDMVPMWVQRLWSQVLQSWQDLTEFSHVVESLAVLEPAASEDTPEGTLVHSEPVGSSSEDDLNQHGAPRRRPKTEPASRGNSESAVKTSSGRVVNKPLRYK